MMSKESPQLSGTVPQTSDLAAMGICAACDGRSDCEIRRGEPVLTCEKFVPVRGCTAEGPGVLVFRNPNAAAEFKGLCVNCDNRDTCRLPRNNGGVWHCSEYR